MLKNEKFNNEKSTTDYEKFMTNQYNILSDILQCVKRIEENTNGSKNTSEYNKTPINNKPANEQTNYNSTNNKSENDKKTY